MHRRPEIVPSIVAYPVAFRVEIAPVNSLRYFIASQKRWSTYATSSRKTAVADVRVRPPRNPHQQRRRIQHQLLRPHLQDWTRPTTKPLGNGYTPRR
eukprot:4420316-Pleurochrysis_carterae.AAC.1